MLNSVLPNGVSAETIATYEAALGWTLHDDIKAFFMAHNGAIIRWIDRNADRFDASLHVEDNDPITMWIMINEIMAYNPQAPSGVIDLPHFEGLFVTDLDKMDLSIDEYCYSDAMIQIDWDETDWDKPWTFRNRTYATKEAFVKRLRILDLPYRYEEMVILLLEEGNPDPPVFLTLSFEPDEHSVHMPLSTYLKLLPHSMGQSLQRDDMFYDPAKWLAANKLF